MFVRAANPVWFMVDLVGQPLNDEYFMFVLENTFPYVPTVIFSDVNGTVAMSNPIQFGPDGTLPVDMYWDPTAVYRLEVRHGDSQVDPLIRLVENFVPGEGDIITQDSFEAADNMIFNPQFQDVSFNPDGYVITSAGTYSIAPGWELVLTGAGSSTLSQIELSAADSAGPPTIDGNPPTALHIANTGWTTAVLQQVFQRNGGIFQNGSICMSATIRPFSVPQQFTLNYVPSGGDPFSPLQTETLDDGVFSTIKGAANLEAVAIPNPNVGDAAFVTMQIVLPTAGTMEITNVQVIGQSTPLPTEFNPDTDIPNFQQESYNSQLNKEFNYYANSLIMLPKKSFLAGWNFSLNPYQFVTTSLTQKAAQTSYIADQTILHQETANSLKTGRASAANRFGLQVKAVNTFTANRFAIIQYIDPATVMPYWGYIVSSLVKAAIETSHGSLIPIKMRLIYNAGLPAAISNTEPIASWAVGADPVFSGDWTEIEPLNDISYTLEAANSDTSFESYSFNAFQLPPCAGASQTLGIVLYTAENMDESAGTEDSIIIDRVSLVPNLFAVDTHPQTFDEALRECEYYFESSYDPFVLPGTATIAGMLNKLQQASDDGGDINTRSHSYELIFKTVKRGVPSSIKYYSPGVGTPDRVTAYIFGTAGPVFASADVTQSGNYQVFTSGKKAISYYPANELILVGHASAPDSYPTGFITFQYTVDSRLGV